MSLRISFFGSSLLSAYWNGAATYYRGIIRYLHELGHTVTFYEPDVYNRQKHRDIAQPHYARSVVYSADLQSLMKCLRDASGSDVIIKTSGIGFMDEYIEKAVLDLKTSINKVIFWDVDAPVTLDRIENNPYDPFRELIGCYDKIFTYGGGQKVVDAYRRFGARSCIPVYNALDPDTHYPVCQEKKFEGALGFLGNRLPDREGRVADFFFNAAQLNSPMLFLLGGNGWNEMDKVCGNIKVLGHVYTHEHNAFNSSVKMVLNINRQSMVSYGYSPPTRIFEAAGAAACIITDAWEGIENFLIPQKECLVAENGRDVAKYVKEIDFMDAKKIGIAARERIKAEHTYAKRAEIVDTQLHAD